MDKLKTVAIDARFYGIEHAGIGRYLRNLLLAIKFLSPHSRPDLRFVLLTNAGNLSRIKIELGNCFEYFRVSSKPYSWQEQLEIKRVLDQISPDLVHFPHFNFPLLYQGRFVVTIHDLIKHYYPDFSNHNRPWRKFVNILGYRFGVSQAIRRASAIIVPTRWWKKRLISRCRIDPGKISPIWEGVDPHLAGKGFSAKRKKLVLNKYHLHEKSYFLYVGNLYPHKNIERMLQAFLLLRKKDVFLTVVCSRPVFDSSWQSLTTKYRLSKNCRYLGFVPDEELRYLYQAALALIQPSLMEGFGLTGLEAMACSCPVLSSNASCLPEVYGKAALFFDPLNPNEINQTMNSFLNNGKMRQKLVGRGKKRVKLFSWQKTAQLTLNVYSRLLKN